MTDQESYRIRVISSLADIPAAKWDSVVKPDLTKSTRSNSRTIKSNNRYQNPFLSSTLR